MNFWENMLLKSSTMVAALRIGLLSEDTLFVSRDRMRGILALVKWRNDQNAIANYWTYYCQIITISIKRLKWRQRLLWHDNCIFFLIKCCWETEAAHINETQKRDTETGHRNAHRTVTLKWHTEVAHRNGTHKWHTEMPDRTGTQKQHTEMAHRSGTQKRHTELAHRKARRNVFYVCQFVVYTYTLHTWPTYGNSALSMVMFVEQCL